MAIRIKINTAFTWTFFMADATDFHTAETGKTVTVYTSEAGGSFTAVAASVSEIGEGWYRCSIAAGEVNAEYGVLRATAEGCYPASESFYTDAYNLTEVGVGVVTNVTNVITLTTRLSAARAGYLDNLNVGGDVASDADIATLLSRLTADRASYLDNLDVGDPVSTSAEVSSVATAVGVVDGNVDTLIARLTAARAGYLDNLSAGAVATQASVDALNNLSGADVNAQVDASIETYRLHELMHTALTGQPVAGSMLADLTEDDPDTPGTQRFTENALSEGPTGSGFTAREESWLRYRIGVPASGEPPAVTISDGDIIDHITLQNDVSQGEVREQVNLALEDNFLNYLGKDDVPDTAPWSATSLFGDMLEVSSSVYRFNASALSEAGGGGGGTADWTEDERENIRYVLGIDGTKTQPATGDSTVQGVDTNVDTLLTRLSAARAGYLDNLSAGAVATAADIAGLNDISEAEVNGQVDAAIETYRLHELMHTPLTAQPVAGSLWADLTEDDPGTPGTQRFNANALTEAPAGGGGGSADWTTGEKEQIRKALGVTGTTAAVEKTGLIMYAAASGLRRVINTTGLETVYEEDDTTPCFDRQHKIQSGANYATATTEPVEVERYS